LGAGAPHRTAPHRHTAPRSAYLQQVNALQLRVEALCISRVLAPRRQLPARRWDDLENAKASAQRLKAAHVRHWI
jgi:hypothetical protein